MDEREPLTYEQAKDKALKVLEYRSHTEKELSGKLRRAGAEYDTIEEVLAFCRNYGFLNDEAYAKAYARDLVRLKKYGERRIRQELSKKGIDRDLIDEAVSELDLSEFDALYPLMEKKLAGSFDRKSIDRATRYFVYRGYSFDDINRCVQELKSEYEE
jgi:regulatory protein